MTEQIRSSDMVELLRADFFARNEPNASWSHTVSDHLLLPALRGFWPMSAHHVALIQQTPVVFVDDIACDYDLVMHAGQMLGLWALGLPPRCHFTRASSEYLYYMIDDLQHDILGTETHIITWQRGLALGGWFRFDSLAGTQGLISKWEETIGNERAYRLYKNATDNIVFEVSIDGIVPAAVTSVGTVAINTWYHCVGRFVPGIDLDVYVDAVRTSAGAAPASIHNSTEPFSMGWTDRSNHFDGNASLCWLSASTCWDNTATAATRNVIPWALFEHSKRMFNR